MTDDRLAAALAALDRVPVPLRWEDVERRRPQPDPGPPRRPRAALVAAATVVAGVALAAAVLLSRPDGPAGPVRTGTPTTTTTVPPGSTTTAPATRTLRTSPVAVVAGDEYLVWGGEAGEGDASVRADGVAYDLVAGTVRPIPPAPVDPRSGATGVWTGRELIVCCGTGRADGFPFDTRSAAAWDPATAAWRALGRPPASIARSYPASVWTGEVMVVIAPEAAAATYDPATDTWAEAPAPPTRGRQPQAVWTGREVVVWDGVYSGHVPPDDAVADRGWWWAPGRVAWEPLPDLPEGLRTQLGSMAWTGDEVAVWGESTGADGVGAGALWRPGDDGWTPMSPSPQGPVRTFDGTAGSQAVAADRAGGRLLVRGLEEDDSGVPPLYAYDVRTDRWAATDLVVPGYAPPLAVAAGRLLLPDTAAPVVGPLPG